MMSKPKTNEELVFGWDEALKISGLASKDALRRKARDGGLRILRSQTTGQMVFRREDLERLRESGSTPAQAVRDLRSEERSMTDSAKTELSREVALDLLDRRQQRKQREAIQTLRLHLAHAIGEMSIPAQQPELYQVRYDSLINKFKRLDAIAADALDDSGILDATTKEEAGRIVDENQRLRLLVHAGVLLHEKVRECDDQDENETDEREWYWAARDILGTHRPPIPHGAESDREAARGWIEEARKRTFRVELGKTASDIVHQRDVLRDGLRKIVATDPPLEHPERDVRTCDLRGIAREALQNAGYTPSGKEK